MFGHTHPIMTLKTRMHDCCTLPVMSLPISSSNAIIATLVVKLWYIFCTWLLTEEILKDIFFVIVEIYRRLYLKKKKNT